MAVEPDFKARLQTYEKRAELDRSTRFICVYQWVFPRDRGRCRRGSLADVEPLLTNRWLRHDISSVGGHAGFWRSAVRSRTQRRDIYPLVPRFALRRGLRFLGKPHHGRSVS